jgi:hypothetical protein
MVGDLLPSADEKKTEAAVRIALVIIIVLLLLSPIYIFSR